MGVRPLHPPEAAAVNGRTWKLAQLMTLFLSTCLAWAQPEGLLVNVPGGTLRGEVFVPRDARGRVPRGLPVAILLHGGGGQASDFGALGAAALAQSHLVILVALEGKDTAFLGRLGDPLDDPGEAMATVLLRELESRYRISRRRVDRAVIGVSLGGFAALHVGITHPRRFGFVGALSGVVEWPQWGPVEVAALPELIQALYVRAFGAPEDPARLRHDLFQLIECAPARPSVSWPCLYLDCGADDLFLAGNERFGELLRAHRVPYLLRRGPGGHNAEFWRASLPKALRAFETCRHAFQKRMQGR